MTLACPVCQEQGEVVLHGPREATVGTVAALLERQPVVACPDQHATAPPEAVQAAMEAVDEAVPRARKRLLRGERCSRCDADLTMPVRRSRWPVSVDASGPLPVLTLHFDLPVTRCPDCGTDHLPSRSQEDLVVAVPAVFAAEAPPRT
jgi:hypothetical protein